MKSVLAATLISWLVLLSNCMPNQIRRSTPQTPFSVVPLTVNASPPQTGLNSAETNILDSYSVTLVPFETLLPADVIVDIPTATESEDIASTIEVKMTDTGKTINMRVGGSFLLKLGLDFYDWTVSIDNENVVSREINITVVNGAQGLFLAHNPGRAKLTAVGSLQCINSTPPCLSPSVVFEVTVIVQ